MSSEFDPEGPQSGWLLRSPQSVQMSAGPDSFHFSLQRTPETFNIQDSIPWINCASGNVLTFISQILICRIFYYPGVQTNRSNLGPIKSYPGVQFKSGTNLFPFTFCPRFRGCHIGWLVWRLWSNWLHLFEKRSSIRSRWSKSCSHNIFVKLDILDLNGMKIYQAYRRVWINSVRGTKNPQLSL